MDPPWFYCPELAAGRIELPAAEARHATGSRRLRPGDALVLFDGEGRRADARIAAPIDAATPRRRGKGPAGLQLDVDAIQTQPPPPRTLTLIVPVCKGARLEWMVEKCTELGVAKLVLTEFKHSVVHADAQHVERLARTVVEACKQCGRARRMAIAAAPTLSEAVALHRGDGLMIAHGVAEAVPAATWLTAKSTYDRLAAVVGPEGGLSPDEVRNLTQGGGELARLGDHVLRVETAAVAVAAAWAALH